MGFLSQGLWDGDTSHTPSSGAVISQRPPGSIRPENNAWGPPCPRGPRLQLKACVIACGLSCVHAGVSGSPPPAPGCGSLRCGLALLLHFCNVSMMSQRACLSLTMVAMVNGTGPQGPPNTSTPEPLDDIKVRGKCRPHARVDSPASLTICVRSGRYRDPCDVITRTRARVSACLASSHRQTRVPGGGLPVPGPGPRLAE